jgi:hypothetical protein
MTDPREFALLLLEQAGLSMPDDEAAKLADSFAPFRARVDALYEIGGDSAEPALEFHPS